MGQLTGVLALLLSESPVLPMNVGRYTSALRQAMGNLQPNDNSVLSMKIMLYLAMDKEIETLF